MNDVDAETGSCHISGKSVSFVKFGYKPAHHGETHKPTVDAVERVGKILRGGVVFAVSVKQKITASRYG